MAMILNISISDHIRTLGKIGPRFYNSENRKSDHEPTTLKIGPKFEYSEKNGHRSNNSEKSDKGRTTRKNWIQIRLLGKNQLQIRLLGTVRLPENIGSRSD